VGEGGEIFLSSLKWELCPRSRAALGGRFEGLWGWEKSITSQDINPRVKSDSGDAWLGWDVLKIART
jgi:hypothetical protein